MTTTTKIKRRFLKAFCKACLFITGALLFSACEVTFTSPLPASLITERDERLSGRWMTQSEGGQVVDYLQIDKGADGEFDIDFESGDPNPTLKVTCARIDGSTYLVIKTTDPNKLKGYLLARYSIAGDKLRVWVMREEKFKQAIRDGKLKGQIGKESYAGVMVTDTPEKIMEFLRINGSEVFEVYAEFEKVKDQ